MPFVLVTLALASRIEVGRTPKPGARVDGVGAVLCALGLAGPVLALISQPLRGWGDPLVFGAGVIGIALLGAFVLWEAHAPHPMLDLNLFRRRNFAVGNLLTFAMYAGLGVVFFLLVLYLQQVAGYEAIEAGLATVPSSIVMFLLSRASARWPTASARARSWASGRSSRRAASCCSRGSRPTRRS